MLVVRQRYWWPRSLTPVKCRPLLDVLLGDRFCSGDFVYQTPTLPVNIIIRMTQTINTGFIWLQPRIFSPCNPFNGSGWKRVVFINYWKKRKEKKNRIQNNRSYSTHRWVYTTIDHLTRGFTPRMNYYSCYCSIRKLSRISTLSYRHWAFAVADLLAYSCLLYDCYSARLRKLLKDRGLPLRWIICVP